MPRINLSLRRAARALALCRDLPLASGVLDLGCGVGGQTLHLADLISGSIVALDSHAPNIKRLLAKYRSDDEALAVLDQLGQEPEMHRRHSEHYAYEFFVARLMG